MTRTMELKEAQAPYLTAFDAAIQSGETVILERDGQPVAVLMPIKAYKALQDRSTILPLSASSQEHLARDRGAYLRLKDELLETHRGYYVGFKDGQLVDSDPDWSTLVERMYARFGYVPIYVKKVEAEEQVYLGRDVLNRFRLLLDGPALAFEVT